MLNKEISTSGLAREIGIAESTLYRWRDGTKTNGEAVSKPKKHEKLSATQKVAIIAESAAFNAAELAEYCRAKGLYPEEVRTWRTQTEQAKACGLVPAKALRDAVAAEKQRNKELERELARKEKALAETAALLTLRKKAAAIWGEGVDE